jgi:hypothetical protein
MDVRVGKAARHPENGADPRVNGERISWPVVVVAGGIRFVNIEITLANGFCRYLGLEIKCSRIIRTKSASGIWCRA